MRIHFEGVKFQILLDIRVNRPGASAASMGAESWSLDTGGVDELKTGCGDNSKLSKDLFL